MPNVNDRVKCAVPRCRERLYKNAPPPPEKWFLIEAVGTLCPFHGKLFIVGAAAMHSKCGASCGEMLS